MQSIPTVGSTQGTTPSGESTSANGSSSIDGTGFAQVLNEQSSKGASSTATELNRSSSTSSGAPSTPPVSSSTASGASAKKAAPGSTHAEHAESPVASSAQSLQSAAAQQAGALNSANLASAPGNAAQNEDQGTARVAQPAGASVEPSVSLAAANPSSLASLAVSSANASEGDDTPRGTTLAKDGGEGQISAVKEDELSYAPGAASAALHAAASFTSSLAQAKAYLGSDSEKKGGSEADDAQLHLTPSVGTPSLLTAATSMTTVQGALDAGATASTAVSSANVPYQIGSDAWRADVSSHVLYFTQQSMQEAQLHLNPAHLGPLDITIKSENNQTTLAFSAAHEATRQAMRDSLPELKQLFASQGVALGNTTVSDQSEGSGNAQQNTSGARFAQDGQSVVTAPAVAARPILLTSLSMVDTFA